MLRLTNRAMHAGMDRLFRCYLAVIWVSVVAPASGADETMALPTAAGETTTLHYLDPGKPDGATLLAPPPLGDSPEQAADMATVREVCHAAGSNDVASAEGEKKLDVFTFAPLIGDFF